MIPDDGDNANAPAFLALYGFRRDRLDVAMQWGAKAVAFYGGSVPLCDVLRRTTFARLPLALVYEADRMIEESAAAHGMHVADGELRRGTTSEDV